MTNEEIDWTTERRRNRRDTAVAAVCIGIIALILAALLSGCVHKGAKITEGTDLAVGLEVPSTDGTLQLDVVNYLTGFRLGVAENAILRVEYTSATTNDWLGIIHNSTTKTISATVEPCERSAE